MDGAVAAVDASVSGSFASSFDGLFGAWSTASNAAMATLQSGSPLEPGVLAGVESAFGAMRDSIDVLSEAIEADLNAASAEAEEVRAAAVASAEGLKSSAAASSATIGLIGILATAGIIGVSFPLVLSVTRRLKSLHGAMDEIASGNADLTRRVSVGKNDEISRLARSFDQVVGRMEDLVVETRVAAKTLGQETQTLSDEVESTAPQIAAQGNAVRQVSAAMTEMAGNIESIAQSCRDAESRAAHAAELAGQGRGLVAQTGSAMEGIQSAFGTGSQSVRELGEKVEEIASLIEVIDGIADQTNLLALNAAIEAARAGEHGRGFAVVADEVRKLADHTTKATAQIVESIRGIGEQTEAAVQQLSQGDEHVAAGGESTRNADGSLEEIERSVESATESVTAISASANEQAQATPVITREAERLAETSDGVERSTTELRRSVERLSGAGADLDRLLSRFTTRSASPAGSAASAGDPEA